MSRKQWRPENVGPRTASSDIGPGDPARGEKVPRCRLCGMPSRKQYKLYPGTWSFIRLNLAMPLCGQCIEELLPDRRALDPMTLEEVA